MSCSLPVPLPPDNTGGTVTVCVSRHGPFCLDGVLQPSCFFTRPSFWGGKKKGYHSNKAHHMSNLTSPHHKKHPPLGLFERETKGKKPFKRKYRNPISTFPAPYSAIVDSCQICSPFSFSEIPLWMCVVVFLQGLDQVVLITYPVNQGSTCK